MPVPLILGIHGRKGEGKTFQCNLIFERMKVYAVHVSGGELESPDAGDPARMIRLRYREAAEPIRKFGQMAVLIINDLDAGAGRLNTMTQYTVNTQLVSATLMNIADNPTNVQLPGSYDPKPLLRVPIIATGNDFSTLYAPLIRDGRMRKFYWEPHSHCPRHFSGRRAVAGGSRAPGGHFSRTGHRLFRRPARPTLRRAGMEVGLEGIAFRLLKSKEGAPHFPPPR
ncbi:AAA family ATPase [Synechococcus sp. OH30]